MDVFLSFFFFSHVPFNPTGDDGANGLAAAAGDVREGTRARGCRRQVCVLLCSCCYLLASSVLFLFAYSCLCFAHACAHSQLLFTNTLALLSFFSAVFAFDFTHASRTAVTWLHTLICAHFVFCFLIVVAEFVLSGKFTPL